MIWLLLLFIVFFLQMATILVLEFRNPSKTIAWLFILLAFPLVGFILYYFVAQEFHGKRVVRRQRKASIKGGTSLRSREASFLFSKEATLIEQEKLLYFLSHIPNSPMLYHNQTDVLTNGEDFYTEMFEALHKARHSILMQFYIFRADEIGTKIQNLLRNKAKEGVQVFLLLDGVGSVKLPRTFVKELKNSGVHVRFFLPPLFSFFSKRINYRNHRKVLVVDEQLGFLGGLNIGDEYLGRVKKYGFWRDTHLKLEGEVVSHLVQSFFADWSLEDQTNKKTLPMRQKADDLLTHNQKDAAYQLEEAVQLIISGPNLPWDLTLETWFALINAARERIYIATPYFIPDPSIKKALKMAALSGVDVRLVIPDLSDSKLTRIASDSYVEEMLLVGIQVYRYQKGFLHAKTLLIDEVVSVVGTANFDMRSLYSNFEINALLFSKKAIDQVAQDFIQDFHDSELVDYEVFSRRSLKRKVLEVGARLLSPLL